MTPGPRRLTLVISSLLGGGAEHVAGMLARCWASSGREVSVVTFGSAESDVNVLPSQVHRIALDLLDDSGHRLGGPRRALGRAAALRRALARLAPEAVVAFGDRTNVVAILATMGSGVPTFACERTDPRHAENPIQWRALRRVLYPFATGVVVQTESVARWARRRWRRVHVIPNPVEPPRALAAPGAEHGPRTLVAMGRLVPVKGFDMLCEAFSRVASHHPEWTLTILGEGPQRPRLEDLVGGLGLRGRVSLPGRVADPGPRLAAAHAFVLSSRHEGFPNALLEAMACGLPVVSFDCPSGPAEIVLHERSGLLVPPADVPRLAEALGRIMGNAEERVRFGREARQVVLSYAPELILQRWNAVLAGRKA